MTEAAKVSAFGGATHNLSHSFNSTLSLDEFLLQGLRSVKPLSYFLALMVSYRPARLDLYESGSIE
jgi:hypothetical protein